MSDPFKILIDRLKRGHTQKIEEQLEPAFLGPNESELRFAHPVHVTGEAYLTDDHLVIHLAAKTQVLMPCAVCNEMIQVDLKSENFYHTEPLEEIPSAVFDFSEALREALLIELPKTVECNGGKCQQRPLITPFLKSGERAEISTHCPFADLNDLK